MSNMGYCRFENTANDLEDCMEEIRHNEHLELSKSEERAKKRIFDMAHEIVEDYMN